MSAFYQFLDKQASEQIIDIVDFAKYHRYKFDDQKDSVSVRVVKELHNSHYAEFEQNYLGPASKDGKIKCGEASLMWIVYEDMREVFSTNTHKDTLRQIDTKCIGFWIEEFKKDIKELWEYGPNIISSAYGIMIDYYRDWMVKQKYDRIYSKGKNFHDFLELSKKNMTLLQGEEMPFDLISIKEKVDIILKIRN